MTWNRDPRLKDLMDAFLRMVVSVDRPYAVGGALAMEAHGYKRETSDLDAFFLPEDRMRWVRAAREAGLKVIEVFDQIHYIAVDPRHNDLEVRMLFPSADPDLAAVEKPVEGRIGDYKITVFPVELLAAAEEPRPSSRLSRRVGDERC